MWVYEVTEEVRGNVKTSFALFEDKDEAIAYKDRLVEGDVAMFWPGAEVHCEGGVETFIHPPHMPPGGHAIIYAVRDRIVVSRLHVTTVSAGPQEYEGMKPITAETRHRWVAPADDVQKRLDAEHLEQFDVT